LLAEQQAKEAVPSGWHLPSDAEWQELVNFAGGDKIAGKKLKATSGWDSFDGQSGNGTDEYGFAALPGGNCGMNSNVFFNYQRMNYDNANVDSDYFDKMVRVSIRYVQD
jgi:uncharacterized protein (TIGR02145 family)